MGNLSPSVSYIICMSVHLISFNFTYLCIFGFAGSSLLLRLFSSCSEPGLLSSCGLRTYCSSFSCAARALGVAARRPWSPGSGVVAVLAYLLRGMWDLLGPGIETCVFCMGRFFTTEPPAEPRFLIVGTKSKQTNLSNRELRLL